jgi:hypothetical protein
MIDDKQLISKLLATNVINQTTLREGLELAEEHNATLYDALIFFELAEEHKVVTAASEILNVPCVDLRQTPVDPDVVAMISGELATSSQSIPIDLIEDEGERVMRLGMTDPIDVMAMDEIASQTGVDIRPFLVGPAILQIAIEEYYDDPGPADEAEQIEEIESIELTELEIEEIEEADADSGDGPELVEAPSGEVANEDSWAAMFDAAEDVGGSLTEDSAVISQEMRDRPATGMFEIAEEELEFEDSDGPVDFSSLAEVSSVGTAVGQPGELANWELDDALTDSGAGSMRTDGNDAESHISGTQIGSPVDPDDWDLDDGYYDDEDEEKDKASSDAQIAENNRTQIGVATRSDLAEYGIPIAGEEEEEVEQAAEEEVEEELEEQEDRADDEKEKKIVPNSIRDALKRASSRKKGKKKPLPLPSSKKQNGQDDDEQDEEVTRERQNSALGRIAVKKVAVPTFKGVVEKRSDLEKETVEKMPQPQLATADEPVTREMSQSDLAGLASLGKQPADEKQAAPLEWPVDLDAELALRALVKLLVEKEVLRPEEVQSLLDAANSD